MKHHLILRVIAKLFIPAILLFALYVQFHGDYGPGGGFQAGVIFAAGLILYALIYGGERARRIIPPWLLRLLLSTGVLLFAGVGVVSMLRGGAYLDYSVLAEQATSGQHWGILIIELGVGITVMAAMLTIFFAFIEGHRLEDE